MKAFAARTGRRTWLVATLMSSALLFFLLSPLASMAQAQRTYAHWWLPENASTQGVQIDRIFYIILFVTMTVFVLVQGTLVVFAIKYRRRDGGRAAYVHGNNKLEIIWTAIPAVFLAFLIFVSQRAWSEIRPSKYFRGEFNKDNAFLVEIVAQQFAWNVRYAGPDGVFGRRNPALISSSNPIGVDYEDPASQDDVVKTNQLHVPVDRLVQVRLTSMDVLHSFFLPDFRLKQDAVPGMLVNLFFQPNKSGAYEIACAELCGLGHYRMRGFLTVHESDESLQSWLAENAPQSAQ